MRRWRRRGCHFLVLSFFPKKKKKYFSREKPLRRRYLKRWGEEEAAGAAAESVGATGGRAATSGTAARAEPDSRDRVRGPRLQSQSLRFSSGCSRGSCAGDAGGHWGCMRPCRAARDGDLGCGPDSSLARSARCPAPSWMLGGQRQNPEPALGPRGTD